MEGEREVFEGDIGRKVRLENYVVGGREGREKKACLKMTTMEGRREGLRACG